MPPSGPWRQAEGGRQDPGGTAGRGLAERRAWSCHPRPEARTDRSLRRNKAPQQTRGAPGAPTAWPQSSQQKALPSTERPHATPHRSRGRWHMVPLVKYRQTIASEDATSVNLSRNADRGIQRAWPFQALQTARQKGRCELPGEGSSLHSDPPDPTGTQHPQASRGR